MAPWRSKGQRIVRFAILIAMIVFMFRAVGRLSEGILWDSDDNWTVPLMNSTQYGQPFVYCDHFHACGKASFSPTWDYYLRKFNISDNQVSEMIQSDDLRILNRDPVFVTAFSDNHYKEAMKSLQTFSAVFPTKTIIIYDLGLRQWRLRELQKLPFVASIRKFDFAAYPKYVRHLYEYRWKPLLLAEILREYEAVLYADAHIIWHQESDLDQLLEKARCWKGDCDHYGSLMLGHTNHSIFATTDKRLYDYFPIPPNISSETEMGEANFQLTYFTKDVRSHLYKWIVLCALERNCMAPKGTTIYCKFRTADHRWTKPAGCHRFDQSVYNILLANRNNYRVAKYLVPFPHSR